MGQYSPTHFEKFSYVLQNSKHRESYTGRGTHWKDVAFGLRALHTWLKTVAEHYSTTASDSC